MRTSVRAMAVAATILGAAAAVGPAFAVKEFYAELEAKYVKRNSTKDADIALAAEFEQAGCTICHPGDDKHKLTSYGGKLSWRVNKFDKQNKKKIQEALDEVGALLSDPHDPKSPTYRELFRQGRLPHDPER